jgi:hypothetical protein
MVLCKLFKTPSKTMCFFKFFIIISIISLVSACSEKAEDQAHQEIHPSFSELPEVTEDSSLRELCWLLPDLQEKVEPVPPAQ